MDMFSNSNDASEIWEYSNTTTAKSSGARKTST